MSKFYKVLIDGKSCHGGYMEWSLPVDGKSGEQHQTDGEISICNRGLHLTSDPARWWRPGCKVYLAEPGPISGSLDDKIVSCSARLLKELTDAELSELKIFTSGTHIALLQYLIR